MKTVLVALTLTDNLEKSKTNMTLDHIDMYSTSSTRDNTSRKTLFIALAKTLSPKLNKHIHIHTNKSLNCREYLNYAIYKLCFANKNRLSDKVVYTNFD